MTNYDLSGLRILIVDDYSPMRRILRDVLAQLGVSRVEEAADGTAALELLGSFDADLVITDNVMEPMNGIELIRHIRAGDSGVNPFTPVIMVSGYTEMENIFGARDAGATEFLAKPISAKLIYLRIRAVIDNPRPFVRSEDFFGPDRRRRPTGFKGDERRNEGYAYKGKTREGGRSA